VSIEHLQPWPKVHDFVVEECLPLTWADFLCGYVHAGQVVAGVEVPRVEVILSACGAIPLCVRGEPKRGGRRRVVRLHRRMLACPSCERPCDAIFLPPPNALNRRWACRWCLNLIYVSQTKRPKNDSLRGVLSPRKTRTAERQHRDSIWKPTPRLRRDLQRAAALPLLQSFSVFSELIERHEMRLPWWIRDAQKILDDDAASNAAASDSPGSL
jgi:hypothetical protein